MVALSSVKLNQKRGHFDVLLLAGKRSGWCSEEVAVHFGLTAFSSDRSDLPLFANVLLLPYVILWPRQRDDMNLVSAARINEKY
jgi:hypothetical protein